MAAAGVKRLRLAPHHTMEISKDWTGPTPAELANLQGEFKGCKAAGIRPCVVFVHIPVMGTDEEGQAWVRNTWKKLMPWGPPGSDAYKAYFEKTWIGLLAVLKSAREAGFTEEGSYDLELGQNLWWGFPALPPFPGLTVESLRPGGMVYEFDKLLLERTRTEGYKEPVLYNGQSHHHLELHRDEEIIPGQAGRAISIYDWYSGTTGKGWLGEKVENGPNGMLTPGFPTDAWPARAPLTFAEGRAPEMVLARPESYLADYTRRDCLIPLLKSGTMPLVLPSLGVVPANLPGATVETKNDKGEVRRVMAEGFDGWDLKARGLTRILAFWLNQGAGFVLLHCAYEAQQGEVSPALIPSFGDKPEAFRWEQSRPLKTLRSFVDALEGAKKIAAPAALKFRFALDQDAELIGPSEKGGRLKASDALALLPFQITETRFAVACYVVTPNIAVRFKPAALTLEVDRKLKGEAATIHPSDQAQGKAAVLARKDNATTLSFPVADDVTWVVFDAE